MTIFPCINPFPVILIRFKELLILLELINQCLLPSLLQDKNRVGFRIFDVFNWWNFNSVFLVLSGLSQIYLFASLNPIICLSLFNWSDPGIVNFKLTSDVSWYGNRQTFPTFMNPFVLDGHFFLDLIFPLFFQLPQSVCIWNHLWTWMFRVCFSQRQEIFGIDKLTSLLQNSEFPVNSWLLDVPK